MAVVREKQKFKSALFASTFEDLRSLFQKSSAVFIDMPMGLPEAPSVQMPWRACDCEARKILSSKRNTVFLIPGRSSVEASDYKTACLRHKKRTGKGFPKQAWGLFERVLEVDRFLRCGKGFQRKIFESHPEVCLWSLNGGRVVEPSKKCGAGQSERVSILSQFAKDAASFYSRQKKCAKREYIRGGDVLDAMVLALSAEVSFLGSRFGQVPEKPPRDRYGIPMRIVFPKELIKKSGEKKS